ncbi:MAG TPA: DUF3293 domain-containing protein [Nevskiaceae bacterium]|nr:DUF3293 domain-containing protein [Nevskiaceae bacterium]
MNVATLRAVYQATHYCFRVAEVEHVFHWGEHAPLAVAVLRSLGVRHRWAVITPCNPCSEQLSPAVNEQRLQVFLMELAAHGSHWLPAVNRSPAGTWPDERGALLCDVAHAEVMALARRYRQRAVLTAALGARPHLAWTHGVCPSA